MYLYFRLRTLVRSVGVFHTKLPFTRAFSEFDAKRHMTSREFVPPSFNEIRFILNRAQMLASCKSLKLITFDGDQTLYEDGGNLSTGAELIPELIALMDLGVVVAVCTAAGYEEAERYETRLHGLLDAMKTMPRVGGSSGSGERRFLVMGGESNYLFECTQEGKLVKVPHDRWAPASRPSSDQISALLDTAQAIFEAKVSSLGLPAMIIRKPLAIGIVPSSPGVKLSRESLDEVALSLQNRLSLHEDLAVPWCAFNGGNDVFVDVGSKQIGVEILQSLVRASPAETMHVGDQFLGTGNDIAARHTAPCIWITKPEETLELLRDLIAVIHTQN